MGVLDMILGVRELRVSLQEFSLSPAFVRMAMVADAARVVGSARREFAAYQEVRSREFGGPAADPSLISRGSRRDLDSMLRLWLITSAALATLCAAAGIVWTQAWHWGRAWAPVPVLAGGAMLVAVVLAWTGWRYANSAPGRRALRGIVGSGSPQLDAARLRLMTAVGRTELLAHVRALINDVRRDPLRHEYSVTSSPRLSTRFNSLNRILTAVEGELDQLIDRLAWEGIAEAGALVSR